MRTSRLSGWILYLNTRVGYALIQATPLWCSRLSCTVPCLEAWKNYSGMMCNIYIYTYTFTCISLCIYTCIHVFIHLYIYIWYAPPKTYPSTCGQRFWAAHDGSWLHSRVSLNRVSPNKPLFGAESKIQDPRLWGSLARKSWIQKDGPE